MLVRITSETLRTFSRMLVVTGAVVGASFAAHAERPCPPDINCSGGVDTDDLLAMLGSWGLPGTPSDVTGDNTVNTDDLLELLGSWGPCQFDFGKPYRNAEAQQIGLEMVDTLTLPLSVYQRIDRDLGLIRAAYPSLADQFHAEAWTTHELIVAIFDGADLTEYQCANAYYGSTGSNYLFGFGGVSYYAVSFAGTFNPEALAAIYTDIPGVDFAEPNGMFGGENKWTPTDLGGGTWQWVVDDAFWDCFDGCDCHKVYTLEVNQAGVVTLMNYEQWGQEWCRF